MLFLLAMSIAAFHYYSGLVATGVALGVGLWAFRTGRQRLSQNCQRARVGFQGFTVLAFLGGAFLEEPPAKEPGYR